MQAPARGFLKIQGGRPKNPDRESSYQSILPVRMEWTPDTQRVIPTQYVSHLHTKKMEQFQQDFLLPPVRPVDSLLRRNLPLSDHNVYGCGTGNEGAPCQ